MAPHADVVDHPARLLVLAGAVDTRDGLGLADDPVQLHRGLSACEQHDQERVANLLTMMRLGRLEALDFNAATGINMQGPALMAITHEPLSSRDYGFVQQGEQFLHECLFLVDTALRLRFDGVHESQGRQHPRTPAHFFWGALASLKGGILPQEHRGSQG